MPDVVVVGVCCFKGKRYWLKGFSSVRSASSRFHDWPLNSLSAEQSARSVRCLFDVFACHSATLHSASFWGCLQPHQMDRVSLAWSYLVSDPFASPDPPTSWCSIPGSLPACFRVFSLEFSMWNMDFTRQEYSTILKTLYSSFLYAFRILVQLCSP